MAASDSRVGVDIVADASTVKPATEQAATAINDLDKPVQDLNAAMENLGKTSVESLNKAGKAANDAGSAVKALGSEAEKGAAHGKAMTASFNVLGTTITANRMQMMESVHVARALFDTIVAGGSPLRAVALESGRVAQIMGAGEGGMAGSMAALTRLMPYVIGGAGLLGLAAAAGFVAVEMHKGAEEQIKFNNSLLLTGGYAGRTSSQLLEMADGISGRLGISASTVRDLELQLVQTGRVGKSAFESMATAAALYAKATGDSKGAVNQFLPLLGNVSSAAADLNEKMHFLSAEQLIQIEQLQRLGDSEDAAKVATDAYNETASKQAENLGILEKVWRALKIDIDAATGALMRWGQQKPEDSADPMTHVQGEIDKNNELIATLEAKKQAVQSGGAIGGRQAYASDFTDSDQKQLEYLKARNSNMEAFLGNMQKSADLKNKDAAAEAIIVAHESQVTQLMEQRSKLQAAIDAGSSQSDRYKQEIAVLDKQIEQAQKKVDGVKSSKGASIVSQLSQQLHDQEVVTGNFFDNQQATELKFWEDHQNVAAKGSRDWLDIQAKIFDLRKAMAVNAYQDQLSADKAKISADKDNWAAQEKDWDKYLADIGAKYHEDSKEYVSAQDEKEAALKAHLQQMAQIEAQAIQAGANTAVAGLHSSAQGQTGVVDTQEQLNRAQARNPKQDISAQTDAANARYQIEATTAKQIEQVQVDAINQQLALENLPVKQAQTLAQQKLEIQRQYQQQAQDLAQQHQIALAQIAVQSLAASQQKWHGYVDGIVSSMGQGVRGMIAQTTSLGQAIANVGLSIVDTMVGAVQKMVQNWIVGELTKKQATAATAALQSAQMTAMSTAAVTTSSLVALADINNSAARAAAAAFASTAAIPIIGPELAPGAAAAAEIATLSFGAQVAASAAGGYDIPSGVNPIVQTHEEEMILPASIANPLRSMISDQRSGSTKGGDNYGGDQYHIYQQPGESAADLAQRIRQAKRLGHKLEV